MSNQIETSFQVQLDNRDRATVFARAILAFPVFIFASAVANQLHSGFIPIRKAGKLPHITISESYGLEYGTDTLEVHLDAVPKGGKVLLIDDVLATGGTIGAAIELMHRLGAEVVHVLALLEIQGLPGRATLESKYPNIPITSLVVS